MAVGNLVRAAYLVAGATAFAAFGVSAQEAPSARATVRASATIVSPVGVETPGAFSLLGEGVDLELRGNVQVRSPAPHVIFANARNWTGQGRSTGFAAVHQGAMGATPQQVRVATTPSTSGEVVLVTYVVAVIL